MFFFHVLNALSFFERVERDEFFLARQCWRGIKRGITHAWAAISHVLFSEMNPRSKPAYELPGVAPQPLAVLNLSSVALPILVAFPSFCQTVSVRKQFRMFSIGLAAILEQIVAQRERV